MAAKSSRTTLGRLVVAFEEGVVRLSLVCKHQQSTGIGRVDQRGINAVRSERCGVISCWVATSSSRHGLWGVTECFWLRVNWNLAEVNLGVSKESERQAKSKSTREKEGVLLTPHSCR